MPFLPKKQAALDAWQWRGTSARLNKKAQSGATTP
jgi:hypothetical protein